jgi:hypothetical protein
MLWTDRDADVSEAATNSAPDLPTTSGELFSAAWARNDFFMQRATGEGDRLDALGDYHKQIKQATGVDLAPELDYGTYGGGMMPDARSLFRQTNDKLAELQAKNPDLKFKSITPEEFEQNAVSKRRAADADYEALLARPRAAAATIGRVVGGVTSDLATPINILTLPLTPIEGIGPVAKAIQWGAIGAGVSAAQEAFAAPYQEEVQPGYIASGAPLLNIAAGGLEVGLAGPILQGAARLAGFVGKPLVQHLAEAWEGARGRAWPESVKEAGDLVTSQANVLASNVYPGTEG